jgi:hypothetical protein
MVTLATQIRRRFGGELAIELPLDDEAFDGKAIRKAVDLHLKGYAVLAAITEALVPIDQHIDAVRQPDHERLPAAPRAELLMQLGEFIGRQWHDERGELRIDADIAR